MVRTGVDGGGRVDLEEGIQGHGYPIRDFVLTSALGVCGLSPTHADGAEESIFGRRG